MNRFLLALCAGLAFAAAAAHAQPGQPRMGMLGTHAEDCSLASLPALCQARLRVDEACGELKGAERRKCKADLKPVASCKRAQDQAACKQRQEAHKTCEDKHGAAFRRCMGDQMASKKK